MCACVSEVSESEWDRERQTIRVALKISRNPCFDFSVSALFLKRLAATTAVINTITTIVSITNVIPSFTHLLSFLRNLARPLLLLIHLSVVFKHTKQFLCRSWYATTRTLSFRRRTLKSEREQGGKKEINKTERSCTIKSKGLSVLTEWCVGTSSR